MRTAEHQAYRPFSKAQARFLVRKIDQEFKRRTKYDPNSGREYFDPPFTPEECDQTEQLLLAVYQSRAAQNPNLPNPKTVEEMHSLLPAQDRLAVLADGTGGLSVLNMCATK